MSSVFKTAIEKLATMLCRELDGARDWDGFPFRAFATLGPTEKVAIVKSSDTEFIAALTMAAVRQLKLRGKKCSMH